MKSSKDAVNVDCPHFFAAALLTQIYRYYAKLHPFAPFLPHMAVRLLGNLQGSSEPVARALTSALEAFANPAEHRLIPFQSDTDGKDDFANRVFSLQLIPGSSQTLAEKLSSLQATLLMAFAVEICNPVNAGKPTARPNLV